MTNALQSTNAPRAVGVEAWFALVTAGCLVGIIARGPTGELGFAVALCFGLSGAVVVARSARSWPGAFAGVEAIWSSVRLWISLAIANLALSAWTTERLALAALWLPCITAGMLHWLGRRDHASAESSTAFEREPPALNSQTDDEVAVDRGDRQHSVEWTQTQDSTGLKNVAGMARLTFRPGERQTELHLAFCPSFATAPALDCQQSGGPDVRIKITQTMSYGARIEIQRADATAWSVVSLEFSATLPREEQAALPVRCAS